MHRSILICVWIYLLLSGCTELKYLFTKPEPPKVSFASVEVKKANLGTIDLVLGLKVDNANDIGITALKTTYEVWVKDKKIAGGALEDKITIAPRGTTEIKLPVKIETMAVLDVVSVYLSGKEPLMLDLKGHTMFESSVGTFNYDFAESKAIDPSK